MSTTATLALKACPFCGDTDTKVFGESAPEWWVTCMGCRASSPCRTTRPQAIAGWNRRAALAQRTDPWRQAVDEALIAHALDCTGPGDDPKEKVKELIEWAVTIATDPRVSETAAREQEAKEIERWKELADSEGSRAVKYLRIIRKVRAVVDEWPEVEMPGSPLSRIRTIVAFAGTAKAEASVTGAEPAAYRYKDVRGHWRYVGAPLSEGWALPANLSFEPLFTYRHLREYGAIARQQGRDEMREWKASRVRDEAWQPIETAPNAEQRDMFVVRAFNVSNGFTGGRNYTSDAYCVWRDIHGGFARWPHQFAPTHWMPLPEPPVGTPKSAEGEGA